MEELTDPGRIQPQSAVSNGGFESSLSGDDPESRFDAAVVGIVGGPRSQEGRRTTLWVPRRLHALRGQFPHRVRSRAD
jgi:hypothetical protein